MSVAKPPAPLSHLRDLEMLLLSHHPLLFLETDEAERAEVLLDHAADHAKIPFFLWSAATGLCLEGTGQPIYGTKSLAGVLGHIGASPVEALYFLKDAAGYLGEPDVQAQLTHAAAPLSKHRGAIVLAGSSLELPLSLLKRFAHVKLEPPSAAEYGAFLSALVTELRGRMDIAVQLDKATLERLLQSLSGLTFFEVQKIVTRVLVEHRVLDANLLSAVSEAKRDAVSKSGVLEYFPADETLGHIAGLDNLKRWLRQRKAVFLEPERATDFGLSSPRGVLVLGVPGCGKSLCAKAVAQEWGIPLVRLDPSRLYNKFVGESEKNLERAMRVAEAMAPIVLWIDEIEKAFGANGESEDGGLSQRIFGTLLSWMQEKKKPVFVFATCNAVDKLPPELMRKGRFDELFFVDLPTLDARKEIFRLHIERKKRSAARFELEALAAMTDGFSGAEIEQAVVSALYAAYDRGVELSTELLKEEVLRTHPLSRTMAESIAELRAWAQGRTVPADVHE